jgi:hypothetical protein
MANPVFTDKEGFGFYSKPVSCSQSMSETHSDKLRAEHCPLKVNEERVHPTCFGMRFHS